MRRRRKKRRSRFIGPFCITLTCVVATGLFAMLSYQWIIEPAKSRKMSHFQVSAKRDTGGNAAVQTGQSMEQIEEQIEEIKNVNDKYADVLNDPAYMVENNIYAKDAADPTQVSVAFAGDILFDPGYAGRSRQASRRT